jgi:tricorn protease
VWSPDGKRIAFSDQTGRIFSLTVETREIVEVARDKAGNAGDYAWSGDGAWLAFSLGRVENGFRSISVWGVEKGDLHQVTSEMFNETEPAWDPSGDYLYYLSDREYAPQLSGVEWNFATNPDDPDLRARPAKGREEPVPARERRSRRGEARRRGQVRREEGRETRRERRKSPRRRRRSPRRPSGSISTASPHASRACPSTTTTSRASRRTRRT